MRHRATHLDDQHAKHYRGEQPGKHRNTGGDVTAELTGDLRTGQRIAQRRQKADHEQWPWRVAANHVHGGTLVPEVEHHDHAEQHRGRNDAAAGCIRETQRQRTAYRRRHEVADVKGQRQADDGWQGKRQHVLEQSLTARAHPHERCTAQAYCQKTTQRGQNRKRCDPYKRQGEEVPGDTPWRTCSAFVDQLFELIGGAVGAQLPDVEQVVVQIELFLDVIDAGTDGAEQSALHQQLGSLGRRLCAIGRFRIRLVLVRCLVVRFRSGFVSSLGVGFGVSLFSRLVVCRHRRTHRQCRYIGRLEIETACE